MRIYIAGPMSGLPDFNLPAFAAAKERLDALGFDAHNPGYRGVIDGYEWHDYIRDGLRMLLDCQAVALLPGWSQSRGAALEYSVARSLAMPVRPIDEWITERTPA